MRHRIRQHTEANLRNCILGVSCKDSDIGLHRDGEADSDRMSVHRCDDRLSQLERRRIHR